MSAAWPTARLGEVLAQSDRAIASSDLPEVNLAGVYSFARGLFKRGPMRPAETSYKTYNLLVRDDFVISQPKAWEGALARVTDEFEGWFLSPVFPTFTADARRLLPAYLEWFCKRKAVWQDLQILSKGMGARRETVSPEQFLSLEIPLPPLDEQRRIVARIKELAAKVEEARGLRQSCSDESATIVGRQIAEFFTARTHSSWRSGTLGDYVIDDCYGTSEKTNDDVSGTPILRMGNIQNGRLTPQPLKYLHIAHKERDKLILAPGDILVNRTNSAELVGKCAVFDLEGDYGFASYIIRIRLDTKRALPQLVAAYINSPIGRAYMFDERKQMTGQANVNATTLKNLPLPLPNIGVQRDLVAELDALQAKVDTVKALQAETAAELDAILPAILDKAFKGEL